MPGKHIIIENSCVVFPAAPVVDMNASGEDCRVLVLDVDSGTETEIFRGKDFSEENFQQRVSLKRESIRESRLAP